MRDRSALVARDDMLELLNARTASLTIEGRLSTGVAVLGPGASMFWTDADGDTFTVTVAAVGATPFIETDVLLAVMEGSQATARDLLAEMTEPERRALWQQLVLAATMAEQTGIDPEPAPVALEPGPSGLKRLGLFGKRTR